ncbi:MAG: CheY-like chemotaxis protein [Candidatus Latescibacterota bacterium]|jgi:CheY-like chemotaxis protein
MNPSKHPILIVEDEPPIRTLLARLLEGAGYETVQASSAEAALSEIRHRQFALILLDLHMPGQIDGEEFLYQMRDSGHDVPIIVVSGWVDDDVADHHPDSVYAVLKKPIQNTKLIATVREALSTDPLQDL